LSAWFWVANAVFQFGNTIGASPAEHNRDFRKAQGSGSASRKCPEHAFDICAEKQKGRREAGLFRLF
jgi:hypothetical protein